MGNIRVENIIVEKNRIRYLYTVSNDIKHFFYTENEFYIEYSCDIDCVPKGVAIVPFLTNILPIAWVTNSTINIEELDKSFYEAINEFKQGFINMYPQVDFRGGVIVDNIVDYQYKPLNKTATFFSGGVDATSTLITRLNEKPDLITLWGADIKFEDISGWNNVKSHITTVAKNFDLNCVFIKSCFRSFLNEGMLDREYRELLNDGWWHGVQHGIGLIGHAAPYAYINKLKVVYIPSTYTSEDKGVTCASDPTIDNFVKFSSCKVYHEGYEKNRQAKIKNIVNKIESINIPITLRVCWEVAGGCNCSRCEKCCRTIMGLLAEKVDPNKYGFDVDYKYIERFIIRIHKMSWITKNLWKDIQKQFLMDKEYWKENKNIRWILVVNFDNINKNLYKRMNLLIHKIKIIIREKILK